jgi:hypothetical protein
MSIGNKLMAVAGLAALAACASGPKEDKPNPQFSSASTAMSFDVGQGDQIDVIKLIDPESRRLMLAGDTCQIAEAELDARKKEVRQAAAVQQLECAFQAFKTYSVSYRRFREMQQDPTVNVYDRASSSLALAIRRNEIQDRLLLRSDALCRDFERRLDIDLRIENDTNLGNFMRNNQTRLVGGVGGLLLGGDIVWALTNATKITDLPGYVHDEGQIEKTTMRIAIEGFKLNRKALFAEIDGARRAPVRHGGLPTAEGSTSGGVTPITGYSLERALSDALLYHSACSVGSGLDFAAKIVSRSTPQTQFLEFPTLMKSGVNP